MKKAEIIQFCRENGITTRNFSSKSKKHKELKNVNPSKLPIWLMAEEVKANNAATLAAQKEKAKQFKMPLKEYTRLHEKSVSLLSDFHTGHSMGCYRRLIIEGTRFAANNTAFEYPRSSKYRAKHGEIEIKLSKSELRKIEKIEGIWTIKGKGNSAKWLADSGSKYSYFVELKHGFLFGTSHAATLEEAYELERKKREAQKREALQDSKFVGIQHIRAAGACNPGIMNFANRHGLNPEFGYNVAYLKTLDPIIKKYLL